MSNAKRFLSVVLAIIMVCSTLVIGANAAYTAYKDSAIATYNKLDQAVLTTDQYASAAMDEVDRMLDDAQLKFTRADIVVGDVDLTSIDSAMNDIYGIVNGTLFNSLKKMLGGLQNLNVNAFRPDTEGGVRRTTAGKTDTDIIYAVFQFLYDNKGILTSFVNGTLDLGTVVGNLLGDKLDDYTNVNRLLKSILYPIVYKDYVTEDAPKPEVPKKEVLDELSVDTMVQDLINNLVDNLVPTLMINDHAIGDCFAGVNLNIDSGTAYDLLDSILKAGYNGIGVYALNDLLRPVIGKLCGIEYNKDEEGNVTEDRSNMNGYAQILNVDYTVTAYSFTSAPIVEQLNNFVKSIADAIINPGFFVWQSGSNAALKDNIVNLAKAVLTQTGDQFFASYIEVADAAEIDAMTAEELTAYALRAIINGSVDGMYIPEEATTLREFGYYALSQLLATSVPELDFSGMDKDSTDTLIVMGIDYAIYSVSSELDMGLSYVYDMAGVDAQLKIAAQYGINNYGGLLNGISFSSSDDGWTTVEKILFKIIDKSWLPAAAGGSIKTFLIDNIINNIIDLDFEAIASLLTGFPSSSELMKTPKQLIINRVVSIVNTIFPGALQSATAIDDLVTNKALATSLGKIIDDLYSYKAQLTASVLPTLCAILKLTNSQEFEFPKLTYDKMILCTSGLLDYNIKFRNSSTGINTGYTDKNGVFHQDSLYTYNIISATASVSGITVSYPSTVNGGQTANINLNGNVGSDTPLRVTVEYNVLTETGEPLTSTPIKEDIYCYLAKTASVETATLTTTAAGGFMVSDGPLNIFAKSFGDITDATLTVENTNTDEISVTPYTNALTLTETTSSKRPVDENGTAYIKVVEEQTTILPKVDSSNGIGKIKVFEMVDDWKTMTSEEKEAAWESTIAHMTVKTSAGVIRSYPKVKITLGATNGTSTTQNTNAYLFIYNDYNLGSLLSSELTKHRQSSAYGDAAAWSNYEAAMIQAVSAVYSPYVVTTFQNASGKASLYGPAFEALTAAIEGLDECALSAGVESTQAIIDQYNPSNEDLEYDDPNYNFFSVSDYVGYTYYNYRDEYRTAQKMINRATTPDENGEVASISELDKTYIEHRLTLYGSRLLPVAANYSHLEAELMDYTRPGIDDGEWSEASWANFQRALAFATSVNNDSTAKQSMINTAYEELLEAEKRLVVGGGEIEDATFELVEPAGEGEITVIDNSDIGLVLKGISGANSFEPEDYFVCNGCHIDVTYPSNGNLGSGSVITVVSDSTGETIVSYTVSVFGDLNGDAVCDTNDITGALLIANNKVSATAIDNISGDFNHDGKMDTNDLTSFSMVASGSVSIDYINCTTTAD